MKELVGDSLSLTQELYYRQQRRTPLTLNVIIATVMLYETKDISIADVLERCKKIYRYMVYCKVETNMTLEPQ